MIKLEFYFSFNERLFLFIILYIYIYLKYCEINFKIYRIYIKKRKKRAIVL